MSRQETACAQFVHDIQEHPDPESCMVSRKAAIEALTGAPAGRVLRALAIGKREKVSGIR